MKRIVFILFLCVGLAVSCSKEQVYGPSSFSVVSETTTLNFRLGETKIIPCDIQNVKVRTVKVPYGWKASISDEITVSSPALWVDGLEANGQMTIYARGYDEVEYVFYFTLNVDRCLSKSEWQMIYCNSFEQKGQSGFPEDMIDASYDTFWNSGFNKGERAPYYFVIDLGGTYGISAVDLVAATEYLDGSGMAVPFCQCADMSLEFANTLRGNGMGDLGGDGYADWSSKLVLGSDVLKNTIHNYISIPSVSCRYVRIKYNSSYYKYTDSAPSYSGGMLSEIDIYTNKH